MLKAFASDLENRVASLALAGIMLLPLAEIVSRRFLGAAIPGSGAFAATLTLWLGMLGAAIAARDGKLLTLATGEFLPKGRISAIAHIVVRHDRRADLPRSSRSAAARSCAAIALAGDHVDRRAADLGRRSRASRSASR